MMRALGFLYLLICLIFSLGLGGCAYHSITPEEQDNSREKALYMQRTSKERIYVVYVENYSPYYCVTFINPEGGSVSIAPRGWYFFTSHHMPTKIAYQINTGTGAVKVREVEAMRTVKRGVWTDGMIGVTVERDNAWPGT